jgi:tRNA(Phe) wybutosine-synthesizing methylase Tyw3
MSEQNLSSSQDVPMLNLPLSEQEQVSLRELLRLCNSEVEASRQRMQRTQEEIDRLSSQIREAMTRLKAA